MALKQKKKFFFLDRTSVLRELSFPTRNLGNLQMTTDTAIYVAKRIVEDKGNSCIPRCYHQLFID